MSKGHIRLVCPNCGCTRGFKPYGRQVESDSPQELLLMPMVLFMFIALLDAIAGLAGLSHKGEYECLKCGCVFRPSGGSSLLGCGIMGVLALGLLIGLVYAFSH
jgi:hypothetical protein